MTKRCAHCLQEKPLAEFNKNNFHNDGLDHRCRECEKKRRRTPEYRAANVARHRRVRIPGGTLWATDLAGRALRCGEIVRQPCAVCGSPDTEMHHEDYSKPLDVVFLCNSHHDEADMRRRQRERTGWVLPALDTTRHLAQSGR